MKQYLVWIEGKGIDATCFPEETAKRYKHSEKSVYILEKWKATLKLFGSDPSEEVRMVYCESCEAGPIRMPNVSKAHSWCAKHRAQLSSHHVYIGERVSHGR